MATSSIFANFSINDSKTAESFVEAIEQSKNENNTVQNNSLSEYLTDKSKIKEFFRKRNKKK